MPVPRKKSCGHCRTAKARCSLTIPCERCADRNLSCDYGSAASRHEPYRMAAFTSEGRHGRNDVSPIYGGSTPTAEVFNGQVTGGSPFDTSQTAAPLGLSETLLEADMNNNFFSVFTNQAFRPNDSSIFGTGYESDLLGDKGGTATDDLLMPSIDLSLSTRLENRSESRLLSQRKTTTTEAFFTAKVLLGQIKQYPKMMIEGKKLPPFIHPKCGSGNWSMNDSCLTEDKHVCLPENLAVCANLIHLFYNRTPTSSRFAWETIYKHQKRLHHEHLRYRSDELLEALQAAVIYLLLQVEDPESVEVNDTLALVETIGDVAQRYRLLVDYQSELSNPYTVDRKTWTEIESARRTINLLWMTELMLNVIIGHPRELDRCNGYVFVPLPCDRRLWDPSLSDVEWTRRYRQSLSSGSPVLRIQDLRFAPRDENFAAAGGGGGGEAVKEGLAKWCEGLDEFGALVWMAGMSARSKS